MLLRSYRSLRAIRMIWEELFIHCDVLFILITRQTYVVFFVHCLQFGVETTYYHVPETVGLYARPRRNFVAWYIFNVARLVFRGVGITAFTTDGCHHFVVLVRYIVFGSKL